MHATHLWNHTSKTGEYNINDVFPGIVPIEVYTGTKINLETLKNEHIWEYPAYVLDPKFQDGKKLPKWDFRTRQVKHLGKSRKHAIFVGLMRNLKSGFISPRFRVIYDHKFETVMGGYEYNEAVADHIWSNLIVDKNAVDNAVAHAENGDDQRVQRDVKNGEGQRVTRMPHVHADWLNEPEKVQRDKNAFHRAVQDKLTAERT